jgi:hypothetical protein
MRSLGAAVVAGAVVALASAGMARGDDKAQPRGGGSSSGSDVGRSHHSGSSGSGSSSSSSSSGSSYRDSGRDSGGSSLFDSGSTGAQDRHPRAGTGTGWRGRGRGGYGYYPYWGGYSGYYGLGYGWGYGWSPYYRAGWWGYDPYYSGFGYGYGSSYGHRYGYAGEGSVRVLVQPKDARVYVDGYYAGEADDFDGLFQRLRISPGRHEIGLKLDGYRSQTFKVYVPYDQTVKVHYKMVKGTGEDVSQTIGNPEEVARYERRATAAAVREAGDEDDDDAGYDGRDREADQRGERGLVRLDVRPADASVYVDGAFRGTGRELRQLRLTPGRHQVEVVRPGYRTIAREVDVRSGEDTDLDIDLDRS